MICCPFCRTVPNRAFRGSIPGECECGKFKFYPSESMWSISVRVQMPNRAGHAWGVRLRYDYMEWLLPRGNTSYISESMREEVTEAIMGAVAVAQVLRS